MQDLDLTTIKLLLVDDEAHSTKLMEAILKQAGYHQITSTNDPRQAVQLYRDLQPDLLALDMRMPHMTGFDVMRDLVPLIPTDDYFPILIITGELDAPTKHKALAEGAKDFLTKPVDPTEVTLRIKNQLVTRQLHRQLHMHNEHLEAQVLVRTKMVEQTQVDLLHRLALASEYRHDVTGAHARHVGKLATLLAEARDLPPEQIELIKKAALLHDVGKIGISDSVLLKEGLYTDTDRAAMKPHTKIGWKLLSDSRAPLLQMAAEIALTHHERWDGTGFLGMKGTQIPLPGRIVTVVDAFDAMTQQCAYKETMTVMQAKAEIEREGGKQFDPDLVALFLMVIDREGNNLVSEPKPVTLVA
ncbi:MAG: Response regulator with domain [Nitrospira sp.]|jgi:putative two-component system response regulator|nr:Response regulator with domain [Nitrospira sp.]